MNKDQAAKKKAEWMAYCLDIGFCDKSQLDELSAIWDKFKDENGNMKKEEYAQQQQPAAERPEGIVFSKDDVTAILKEVFTLFNKGFSINEIANLFKDKFNINITNKD